MATSGPAIDEARDLRQLLLAERARLVAQAVAMSRTLDELDAAADLEPPDDEHDPDGTTAYERAQVHSLRAEAEHVVVAIDAALAGLDAGTYGSCTRCSAPIPFDRLAAVLGTDLCRPCAAGGAPSS